MSRRRPFQIHLRQRIWLYSAFSISIGSGISWAILWHFFREEIDMALPIENKILKLHLAAALLLLVTIGSALPNHASKSWAARTNRTASLLFIASIFGTVVTGYGILAFVWETSIMHFSHLFLGLAMMILLPLHILIGRYLEKRRMSGK